MLCPFCREKDTSVVDSRPTEDGSAIRRRRVCGCPRKERFTTFERVQFRELTVVKSNGRKEPFERDKLTRSLKIALQKRQVEEEKIERIGNSIQRKLETLGETEVPSKVIGEIVMDQLADLDQVAYVRFASVYRNFREAKDFEAFIGTLSEEADE